MCYCWLFLCVTTLVAADSVYEFLSCHCHWLFVLAVRLFSINSEVSYIATYSGSIILTTSLMLLSVSTGYECQKGSFSSSPCRLTGHCMLMLRKPQYLRQFMYTADIPSRKSLWSSTSYSLFVPAVRLSTVGTHAFSVTDACVWNDLLFDLTSSPSLLTFKQRLKMHLFVAPTSVLPCSCLLLRRLGHVKKNKIVWLIDWLIDWLIAIKRSFYCWQVWWL